MNTGERIRNYREDADILQQELADATGINVSVLNRIEKGTRAVRDDELVKIANKLQVSTDYLLGRTDIPEPLPPYINKNLTPEQLAKFKADVASLTKSGKFSWDAISFVPADDDTPQVSPHDTPQVSPQGIRIPPNPSEKSENGTTLVPLDADERECIRKYRALTDDQRGAIKNQIDYFYAKSISEDSAKDGAS